MRLGRGMYAVNRLGRDIHRRIEAESKIGARKIVVNRLRNANHIDAVLKKFLRHRKRVIATNRNQSLAIMSSQVLGAAPQAIVILCRIGARSPQNGASPRQNSTDGEQV